MAERLSKLLHQHSLMKSQYQEHDKAKPEELQATEVNCKQFQHKLTHPKCREDLCYKALKLTQKPTRLTPALNAVADFLNYFKRITQK